MTERTEQKNPLETILQERDPLIEKMVYETSKQLFDKNKILMISDLSADQINYYFKLIIIDDLFYKKYATGKDRNKYTNLFEKMLQLTISKNRQSRGEIVNMFQILKVVAEQEERKKSFLRR